MACDLLSRGSDQHVPVPGTVELAEVESLPGSERQAAIDNRYPEREPHQRGLDMGIGVPFGMPVMPGHRYQPGKTGEDIPRDVRVSVLVDGQAGGRMGHVHGAGTGGDPCFFKFSGNKAGDIDHLGSRMGRDCNRRPLHVAHLGEALWPSS